MQDTPTAYQEVSIYLSDKVDARMLGYQWENEGVPLSRRSSLIINLLQQKAASTQGPLLSALSQQSGVLTGSVVPLWITNVVEVQMTDEAIKQISLRPEIEMISWNEPMRALTPTKQASPTKTSAANSHEVGLTAIHAPELWKLGYSGYGRKTLTIDTGVDGTHPALARSFWGNFVPISQAWFDLGGRAFPQDCDGHGTHTTGTSVGLNTANNDTIGVAPNALWMAATGVTDFEGKCAAYSLTQAMQWAINPDGNVATSNDMPDVINNSWGSTASSNSCFDGRKAVFDAVEAAGIALVFSAGNNGPDSLTIGSPAVINTDLVNVFSIGAVNAQAANFPIASFSSRGPSLCATTDQALRIKPEVSAPGVNVRSSLPGNTYGQLSGTSMAAPHVTGAILLLKEAFPNLSGTTLKLALYNTAVDLGVPGEDNQYGRGIINVYAAYQYLITQGNQPVIVQQQNDAVASDIANLNPRVCTNNVFPFFILKNQGNNVLTSAKIIYTYSTGVVDSISWTGNLPKNNILPIPLSALTLPNGSYTLTIEVKMPNGTVDDRPLDNKLVRNFTVATGPAVTAVGDTVCVNNRARLIANLTGNTGIIQWFDVPAAGASVGKGPVYVTPSLNGNRIFYAEGGEVGSTGLLAPNPNDTYGIQIAPGLEFDAIQGFTLESVTFYARFAGLRVVQLLNSQGSVIASKSVFLQKDSVVKMQLGFNVPAGTGYVLAASGSANLKMTASTTYPIQVPGVVSINRATDNSSNYYYFYDWKIAYNPSCNRVAVDAVTTAGQVSPGIGVSDSLVDLSVSGDVQFVDITPGSTDRSWDFGDGSTSTSFSTTHTYTAPGTYLVTLSATVAGTCFGVASKTIQVNGVSTGIQDSFSDEEISLFPNPGNGLYTLDIHLQETTPLSIRLLDLTGRVVWEQKVQQISKASVKVDIHSLPDGVYLLQVQSADRSQAIRVLKHE